MCNMKIGWSEISITPDKKVGLAGQFAERISTHVEKPLTVTAMAVEAAGEQMVLQGVADCAFVEDGKLVVVDFKTDRVEGDALTERAETYRPQLSAYARALAEILEMPVEEKIVYFFHKNSAISL